MTRRNPRQPIGENTSRPRETSTPVERQNLKEKKSVERLKLVEKMRSREEELYTEVRDRIAELMQEFRKRGEWRMPAWVREGVLALGLMAPSTAIADGVSGEFPDLASPPLPETQRERLEKTQAKEFSESLPKIPKESAKKLSKLIEDGAEIYIRYSPDISDYQALSKEQVETRQSFRCDWNCSIRVQKNISLAEVTNIDSLIPEGSEIVSNEEGEFMASTHETVDAYGNKIVTDVFKLKDSYIYSQDIYFSDVVQELPEVGTLPINIDLTAFGYGKVEKVGYFSPRIHLSDISSVPLVVSGLERQEIEPIAAPYYESIQDGIQQPVELFGLDSSPVSRISLVDTEVRNAFMRDDGEMYLFDELFKVTSRDPYADPSIPLTEKQVESIVSHETFHGILTLTGLLNDPIFSDLFFSFSSDYYDALSENKNGMYGGHAGDNPSEAVTSILNFALSPDFETNIRHLDNAQQIVLYANLYELKESCGRNTAISKDAPIFDLMDKRLTSLETLSPEKMASVKAALAF